MSLFHQWERVMPKSELQQALSQFVKLTDSTKQSTDQYGLLSDWQSKPHLKRLIEPLTDFKVNDEG